MTIGNTPLARLDRLREEGSADIFVKWEGANPLVFRDPHAIQGSNAS